MHCIVRQIYLSNNMVLLAKCLTKFGRDVCFGSISRYSKNTNSHHQKQRVETVVNDLLFQGEHNLEEYWREINQYDYKFENLAFEGGGVRMPAYLGALQILDKMKILNKCRRIAGTSSGAVITALLGVGLLPSDIQALSIDNPYEFIIDHPLGKTAIISELYRNYGWNKAEKFYLKLRSIIGKQSGNPDISFSEVFSRYGKELCIVATNLSTGSAAYFHPKTTPDMPVALAVRSSIALPVYVQPVKINSRDITQESYYIDGGLLCNYPLHVFDGWFLSMDKNHTFFSMLNIEDDRFGTFNPKTLGLKLICPLEGDFLQTELSIRLQKNNMKLLRPNTPLSKKNRKLADKLIAFAEKAHLRIEAANRVCEILDSMDVDRSGTVSREEFMMKHQLICSCEHIRSIFGPEIVNADLWFSQLAKNGKNNEITFNSFLGFLNNQGLRFKASLDGSNYREIHDWNDYINSILRSVFNNNLQLQYKPDDLKRTIGINTDYIRATDLKVSNLDKEYMIKQGALCTIAYFYDMVIKHKEESLGQMTSMIDRKHRAYGINQQSAGIGDNDYDFFPTGKYSAFAKQDPKPA